MKKDTKKPMSYAVFSKKHCKGLRSKARKYGLPGDLSYEQYKVTYKAFNEGCALTGDKTCLQWDHVIPLSTGQGGSVYGNVMPLRADLNYSKETQNLFEWFAENKDELDLSESRFNKTIQWLSEANGMTVDEYRKHVYAAHDEVEKNAVLVPVFRGSTSN